MIFNKEEIKLITQLLGNRIAELKKIIAKDEEYDIRPKYRKYLIKELDLAENILNEIVSNDICFIEKVILKDGYRACCGKEITDESANKYCKYVWLKN